MLGSRVDLLYLSGMQRRKGGSGMLVIGLGEKSEGDEPPHTREEGLRVSIRLA